MSSKLKWLIGIIILISTIIVVYIWYQSQKVKGLEVDFQTSQQVRVGIPFDFLILINNQSKSVFKDVRLSITLPEDIIFVGQPRDKNIDYKEIGNIGIQGLVQESFKLMALSGENSLKRLQISVSYLPTALGARFEKEEFFDLTIGQSGLPIDIVTPTKVFSGEDFESVISFRNDSEIDYNNLKLIIDYPPSFNFVKSNVQLENNNREWKLGDLRRNSKNEFKIVSNLIGPDEAFFDLKISLEAEFLGQQYIISSQTATISIAPSPLSLRIDLNETANYIARSGDELHYTLTYINNIDIGLRDVVLKVKLIGEMFDFSNLITDAIYNSLENTLTWNASNKPQLALIVAGDAGSVDFRLKVKENYPIKRLNDKNFILQVLAEIESPTVPYFVAASKTINSLKFETLVAGKIEIDSRAYFRDAAAGIINKGYFPPKVNQATNFTIHWIITNFATDVSNVEIKAFLGPNVELTDIIRSNINSLPVYNPQTQEIKWEIDKIIATKGVISKPIEAIFQVKVIPSKAGNYWPLIKETVLTAVDEFTGELLAAQDQGISTALPDDPSITSSQGIVVE